METKLLKMTAWIFCGMTVAGLMAQTASVNWLCMPPDSQNVSAISGNLTGLPETGSSGFAVRDYDYGPGPDQRWWPFENGAAVNWGDETAQVESRWVQFAVYPNPAFRFHADSLPVILGAKGTNAVKAAIYAKTDTDFTAAIPLNAEPLNLKKDADTLYTFPFNMDVEDDETLYVRIYPWYTGPQSASKYLYVRNATIMGTTTGLAYPASAVWELTNPAAGGTGLSAAVAGAISAGDETLKGMEINQYTGPSESQRARIAGNVWPNNRTSRIDTVYLQYAVTPDPGLNLAVTSVSLGIAAFGINTMKAEILYSTRADFSNPTPIDYVTTDATGNNYLPLDILAPVSVNPNVEVASGDTFYLRIYSWVNNDPALRTGKYVCLKHVEIAGEVRGNVVFNRPTLTTDDATYISTTFAASGGHIADDGGAPVTSRGVCWNTTGAPTVSDEKTEDGLGTGSFVSPINHLSSGTEYHLRAYAVNAVGTAYGNEVVFTTLDSVVVPTVVGDSLVTALVKSAQFVGSVTDWGGDSVLVRGVCWNTDGNPTLLDSKTENGRGLGSFTGILYPLTANTQYFVRAYATNSRGTGYSEPVVFQTQSSAPDVTVVVAKDGTGDYATVQAAFDAVPDAYTGVYRIYVRQGVYREKLLLGRTKGNVILQGENAATTILTYDDYAGKAGGTSNSQSVAIDADDFTAMDITFQNTVQNDGSFQDQQAVALRSNGDRQSFYRCRILGYQDTYYAWGGRGTGRVYMKDCLIEGSVDFIFGRDIVVFDHCEIHINREGGTLTAANTDPSALFGLVFMDCNITSDAVGFDGRTLSQFYLGRPWQQAPRTVFLRCVEPANLNRAGWLAWNVPPALYAEYQCTGLGAGTANRAVFSRQLTDAEAAGYTLGAIFSKNSFPGLGYDWVPEEPVVSPVEEESNSGIIPSSFALSHNFPNPFNPATTIQYDLPKAGHVVIRLFNPLGEKVMTVVDQNREAGRYTVFMNARHLASGVYYYQIQAGDFTATRKMLLLK